LHEDDLNRSLLSRCGFCVSRHGGPRTGQLKLTVNKVLGEPHTKIPYGPFWTSAWRVLDNSSPSETARAELSAQSLIHCWHRRKRKNCALFSFYLPPEMGPRVMV